MTSPSDLPSIAHRGLLPGKGPVLVPPVVAALRLDPGVLAWRELGDPFTVEVAVTWERLLSEVAAARVSGAFQFGEVRDEHGGCVVEAYIVYAEGPAFLAASLPEGAELPEWAE